MLEVIQNIKQKLNKLFFILFLKNSFYAFGKRSSIITPYRVDGAKYVSVGRKVHIAAFSWILALRNDQYKPFVKIGDETRIARFLHLVAVRKVKIGDNVLIAEKVYISDNIHSFEDVDIPIKKQPVKFLKEVTIGDNTWIGEGVSVIGASIGKRSVIGANSVVLSDIPDYCVAVGSPAKIIKRYNHKTKKWEKVSE